MGFRRFEKLWENKNVLHECQKFRNCCVLQKQRGQFPGQSGPLPSQLLRRSLQYILGWKKPPQNIIEGKASFYEEKKPVGITTNGLAS